MPPFLVYGWEVRVVAPLVDGLCGLATTNEVLVVEELFLRSSRRSGVLEAATLAIRFLRLADVSFMWSIFW